MTLVIRKCFPTVSEGMKFLAHTNRKCSTLKTCFQVKHRLKGSHPAYGFVWNSQDSPLPNYIYGMGISLIAYDIYLFIFHPEKGWEIEVCLTQRMGGLVKFPRYLTSDTVFRVEYRLHELPYSFELVKTIVVGALELQR